MTNLITTILSIALAAIVTVFGIYYISDSFSQNQDKIRATAFIEQSRQIWGAANQYVLENGLSNFNDIMDTRFLVTRKYLSNIPGIIDLSAITTTNNSYTLDYACATVEGVPYASIYRSLGRINGKDVILYVMRSGGPNCYTAGDILSSSANSKNPLVRLCVELNKRVTLPAGLTLAASGIPYAADGTSSTANANVYSLYMSGTDKLNYCYLHVTSGNGYIIYLRSRINRASIKLGAGVDKVRFGTIF